MAKNEAVVYLGVDIGDLDPIERSTLLDTLDTVDFLPDRKEMMLIDADLDHDAVDEIRNYEMEVRENDGT